MKQRRRPIRRKPSRQPRKRLPPTSTDKLPQLDWLTVEQPTPPRVRARNPALMSSGVIQPPSPPRQASNPALNPVGTSDGSLPLRDQIPVEPVAPDHTEPVPVAVTDPTPKQQFAEMLSRIEVLEALM